MSILPGTYVQTTIQPMGGIYQFSKIVNMFIANSAEGMLADPPFQNKPKE